MVTMLDNGKEDTEQNNMRDCNIGIPFESSRLRAGEDCFYKLCDKEKKLQTTLLDRAPVPLKETCLHL